MNTEIAVDHILLNDLNITNDDIGIHINGEINTELVTEVCDKLMCLDKKSLAFIPITIHSGGGSVDDLLKLMNCVDMCQTPIMTICMSCACSAAAVIFCLGSNNLRIMAPNSYLMFHESSMGVEGKQCDIAATNNQFIKIDKMINRKLEKHMDLEINFFENNGVVDMYVSAKEALKFGLTSHVGFPAIKMKISLDMSFELKGNKRHEVEDINKRNKYCKVMPGSVCNNALDLLK